MTCSDLKPPTTRSGNEAPAAVLCLPRVQWCLPELRGQEEQQRKRRRKKKKENWKKDRDWGGDWGKKKGTTYGGKDKKRIKRKLKGKAAMRQKKEPSQCGRGMMLLRVVVVCAEQAASAAAPSCDKCHQPSLTPDKGSVHQRCQLWRPAGSTVTFSPVHSERSSSIFPYFTTPSAERLPFSSAQPFCSPRCFLAPIAQKRSQAAEIESSDPASQGEAVWAWIQPKAPKHQIDGSAAVSLNIPWIHPWEHWEVSSSTVLLQKTVTSFENANWL